MQIIKAVAPMREAVAGLRREDRKVALVPTMGALHEGHKSLIRRAREVADVVLVTIFVNPVQFAPNEDFDAYPRDIEGDLVACEELGVDYVFLPAADEIYPAGYSTYINEEQLGKTLCGVSRPGHFKGVCTVVAKLFNICQPQVAVFGQKDAQQAAIIGRMIRDLNYEIELVICPTIREPDGLAMSSRNRNLSSGQRTEALRIHQALSAASKLIDEGVRQVNRLEAEIINQLIHSRRIRVIYVSIVHRESLEPLELLEEGKTLIAVAVWVDEVRLLDNILV